MEELAWGTPLFFDLWMAGMAGGAYFAGFLLHAFGVDREKRLLKGAVYVGVPLVLLGVMTLVIDLGEPMGSWHLFVRLRPLLWKVIPGSGAASIRGWPPALSVYPISPMSMGSWVLVIWSTSAVVLMALWFAEAAERPEELGDLLGGVAKALRPLVRAEKALTWIGLLFAILMMTYTGVVLSASSQPLWETTLLLPALFVVSATATGVAALIPIGKVAGGRARALEPGMTLLREVLGVLLAIQLVVLVAFVIWLNSAGEMGPLVSGRQGLLFWIGAVLVGLVIPMVLEFGALARKVEARGASMLVSPILVMLGGFALRAAVIIGGQM